MNTSLTPLPQASERRTYRCTFSLPIPLAKALSTVAKAMGVSQSALLAQLLDQPLQDLLRVFELAPPPGSSPDAMLRWKGQSANLIQQRVKEAIATAQEIEPPLL